MKLNMKKKYMKYFRIIFINNCSLLFLFIIFIIICSNILTVGIPLIQQNFIDKLIYSIDKEYFFKILFIMGVVYLLDIFFNIIKDYYGVKLVEKINFIFRKKLNVSIAQMKYYYFFEGDIEKATSRYTSDITAISNHFGNVLVDSIKYLLMFIFIVASIKLIDTTLLLFTLATLVFYLILNRYIGKILNEAISNYLEKSEASLGIFLENRKNVFLTKTYNLYEWINERFLKSYKESYDSRMRTEKIYCFNINSTKFILHFLNIIVFFIVGMRVIQGKSTVGNLIAMMQYQNMIISPFYFLAVFNNSLQSTLNSIERLDEFFDADYEIMERGHTINNIFSIELKDINFSYDNDTIVLQGVNLVACRGEVVGLIGPSGSGKSTLINLLLGLYEPTKGEIFVNGVNTKDLKLRDVRELIGCVPQESLFFSESILDNLFVQETELQKAINIGVKIDINDEIQKMPESYQTMLLANGNNLSGGQKKRVDILRILLSQKEIIIFDECTAMLDSVRRSFFFDMVKEIKKDKIIFLISHNSEEFKNCDKVYKIQNNEIFLEPWK